MIYKSHIYYEASIDSERCTHKSDEKAKRCSIIAHLRQVDQYAEVNSPHRDPQEDEIWMTKREKRRRDNNTQKFHPTEVDNNAR
jgi:hypothetical protein